MASPSCQPHIPAQQHPLFSSLLLRSNKTSQQTPIRSIQALADFESAEIEPHTDINADNSIEVLNNGDSLDSSDFPFSQEHPDALVHETSDTSSSSSLPDDDITVLDIELQSLRQLQTYINNPANCYTAEGALCEDLLSGVFHDYDEELCDQNSYIEDIENYYDSQQIDAEVCEQNLLARAVSQQEGGLDDWLYECPFIGVDIAVDDVDLMLEERFVCETNTILDNVLTEAAVVSRVRGLESSMVQGIDARLVATDYKRS